MQSSRLLRFSLTAAFALGSAAAFAQAPPEPQPPVQPPNEPAPPPQPPAEPPPPPPPGDVPMQFEQPPEAEISEEAQEELDRIGQAYAEVASLQLDGSVRADFDVAGEQADHQADFTSVFQAPNKFRHEMEDDILIGSTGEITYAYRPADNLYITGQAPPQRVPVQMLPQPIPQILQMQNPSLLLALTDNAGEQLAMGVTRIEKEQDVEIDDKSYTALKLTAPSGDLSMLIDPDTHLVRRILVDLSGVLEAQGQPDVRSAELVFDYTRAVANGEIDEAQFTWTPPADAIDAAELQRQQQQQQQPPPAPPVQPRPEPQPGEPVAPEGAPELP